MGIDGFLRQIAAGPVVAAEFSGRMIFLRVAEAVIGMAAFYEFFGIFFIKRKALALDIRAAAAADIRSFVGDDAGQLQRAVDEIYRIRDVAGAVGILDAQNKITLLRLGVEISIERCAQIADMHISRRTWRETCAYFLICQCMLLLIHTDYNVSNFLL